MVLFIRDLPTPGSSSDGVIIVMDDAEEVPCVAGVVLGGGAPFLIDARSDHMAVIKA
jgi:hypothetical protein